MTYQSANGRLSGEGWFASLEGPSGTCPVQAFGTLVSGEVCHFRSRGCLAVLDIYRGRDLIATYSELVAKFPLAGYLSAERCFELITKWLRQYRASLQQP